MARVIDFQRQRIYNWEKATGLYATPHLMSLVEAQQLCDRIWSDERMSGPAPIINFVPGRIRGTAHGSRSISIGNQYIYSRYVVHEVAHCINHARYATTNTELRHGPQFLSLLIQLRVRYCGDSAAYLFATALQYKLVVTALDPEVERLQLLKNSTTDPDERKRIRRQLRAANRRALRDAAGTGD